MKRQSCLLFSKFLSLFLLAPFLLLGQQEITIYFSTNYPQNYKILPISMRDRVSIEFFGEQKIVPEGIHLSYVPDLLGHSGHEGGFRIICEGQVDLIEVDVFKDQSSWPSNGMDIKLWAQFYIPAFRGKWNKIIEKNPIQIKGNGNKRYELKGRYNTFFTDNNINVIGMSQGIAGEKARKTKLELSAYGYDDFIVRIVRLHINK